MKALLHIEEGKNETVDMLVDISEKMGDVKEFVNAAYTNSYYKGNRFSASGSFILTLLTFMPAFFFQYCSEHV